ncbi:multidrug DMT transporter permease [Caballeronia novacaledonica]|uniref:Multidrug DMT transporter permease n=1 Tax=Caballeronia novacaledonica TaxID=1544861 RepID=A0A2U3I3F0_9BURK|nr:MFS transporter [Caballeronia novacaledonica]SPB14628.1 multidrug DMT transporter permease [Caballeronia novacaledonica]
MHLSPDLQSAIHRDRYVTGRREAWFAFAMTFALMLFDFIDRQVIVSLFPHIKSEWNLSDKQLGSLVSIVSVVVAAGGIPVALIADRTGRVKSIVAMAIAWSLATISCMFTGNYGQLFAARAVVGLGETGYGSVGAALIATLFPQRLRSAALGVFFAAPTLGSVLGVFPGGMIAAHWGWKAAFGVVGVPGLLLALIYLRVRDYNTVTLIFEKPRTGGMLAHIFKTMLRTRTLLFVCAGAAAQLITISALWAWLPSYLNRYHGMNVEAAAKAAAGVVLVSALSCTFWGITVGRLTQRTPRNKLPALSMLCVTTCAIFIVAFGGSFIGGAQFILIVIGAFFMNCTVGIVAGVAMDVVHPGMRSTGAAVMSLFQNMFGLAVGPFLAGVLSDRWGLQHALALTPLCSLLAALFFVVAMQSYDRDVLRIVAAEENLAPIATDDRLSETEGVTSA